MQPLFPLVFHNLPSLYPLHLEEMIFLYLFYPFLTVPNAPSKTMLAKKRGCSKRGSNSDRTVTTLRYKRLRYATLICHKLRKPRRATSCALRFAFCASRFAFCASLCASRFAFCALFLRFALCKMGVGGGAQYHVFVRSLVARHGVQG